MKILMTTCGGFVKEMQSWSERCLAKELIKMGCEVTALTSASVMKTFPSAKKEEIIDGILVKRFGPRLPSSFFYMLRNDFDIIHTHFPGYMAPISSYAALRKKIKNIPMVHSVHGLYHDPYLVKDIDDPFSKPIKYKNMQKNFPLKPWRIKNWFCHLPIFIADKILPQNQFEKNELKKFGVNEEKMEIIPTSGINPIKKLPSKKTFKEKYDIEDEMILFFGQPIKRKGPQYLIKAMPEILKEFPKAKLVFAGYKRNEELENLCKELGIMNSVKFLGFLSEDDKIACYRSCDVYCLPTNYEGFGVTFLEAMACGSPIVTTDTPGISELIENGVNGLLVKPKCPEAIASAIIKILQNKRLQKRFERNNMKKVKDYYWSKITKRIFEVYEDVVNRP